MNTIDQDVKLALIKKQSLFSYFTEQEIDDLSELFIEQQVKAGTVIVKEGDLVDSVFLIVSGKADVRKTTFDENDKPKVNSLATLGPSNAIGLNDTGFYSLTGKRTATVIAMTEMVMFRLSIPAYHGFTLVHSHANEVMHQLAEKQFSDSGQK